MARRVRGHKGATATAGTRITRRGMVGGSGATSKTPTNRARELILEMGNGNTAASPGATGSLTTPEEEDAKAAMVIALTVGASRLREPIVE